ncbi:Zinc finger, FYVE/PHD-type domain containing protein [Parasponia andersonii]|uniref:Zinc finger, FYVE/PHD-type domain containing protein n=1 Tax=Parasponia andersonii TaxID=3476 RepID=A0A2P5CLI8_PARAD|nr:Zinc finger, FYVE/PHD-type domain containing protein [Parasponia andersonii]
MGRKRKEEICEDCCFNCKDGGYLMICDYKNCLKAYHPECVGKDDAFVESGEHWTCSMRNERFSIFPHPFIQTGIRASFAKSLQNFTVFAALELLAVLIENGSSVDPDGVTVNFNEQSTYECYFLSYWEIVKKKEGLTGDTVHFADNLLKKGKNYDSYSLQTGNLGQDISESEDEILPVSDYDDSEEIEEYKPDSKEQMLQHEVASIVIDYCKENQLFDPEKKKKIICDARLHSRFRRKFLFRNRLVRLLDDHFAENFEQSKGDRFWSSMDDADEKVKRQRNLGTVRETKKTKVTPNLQKSCFASVNAENIKPVYLKRSLVEELLK